MGVTLGGVFKLCLVLCWFFSVVIIWMRLSWESKDFGVNSGSGLIVLCKVWNYMLNSMQPKLCQVHHLMKADHIMWWWRAFTSNDPTKWSFPPPQKDHSVIGVLVSQILCSLLHVWTFWIFWLYNLLYVFKNWRMGLASFLFHAILWILCNKQLL